jgi:hypothetical protein
MDFRKKGRSAVRLVVAAAVLAVLFRYAVGLRPALAPRKDPIRSVERVADSEQGPSRGQDRGADWPSDNSPAQVPQAPSLFLDDDEDIAQDEEVERADAGVFDASAASQPEDEPLPVATSAASGVELPVLPTAAATDNSGVSGNDEDTPFDAASSGQGGNQNGDLLTALQQASQPEGVSDFIGGARVTRPGTGSSAGGAAARDTPQAEVAASPTPVDTRSWVAGQARGYAMLYAMQPQARPVVEAHVQTLIESRVREPFVAILIDGTFGEDFEYAKSIITRLSKEGRRLTLALYLSNGPTMRVWDSTPIDALFSRMEPEAFRYRIMEEVELQDRYAAVVASARALFEFNKLENPANSNVAVVMLEDNLTIDSYRFMRDIVREGLVGVDVSLVRNPCVGCYRGNDGDTMGDGREEHSVERFGMLEQGDGFTLDGTGFEYSGEASSKGLSSSALLQLMRDSMQRKLRYVGLWRFPWQGLTPGGGKPHPSERSYVPSSETERAFEIEALREGLVVEGAGR